MNEYYGYIYKITIPTSKGNRFYWGQHKYNNYPSIDLKYWGSGIKLTNWIKTHLGKQKRPSRLEIDLAESLGLKREILCWGKSIQELNELELKIIEPHLFKKYCWNIHPGGEGGSRKQSSKTKSKISKANKGKKNPWLKEYNKLHLAERNKKHKNALGCKHWNNGKQEKLSKKCPGEGWILGRLSTTMCNWYNNCINEIYSKNCPEGFKPGKLKPITQKRKVKCIELNKLFDSIQEACLFCKVNHSHISDCCNGKRNVWHGYHWEYV